MFRAVQRRLTEPAILRALATPCTGKQSILCLVKRNNCALESFQNMSCHCITVDVRIAGQDSGCQGVGRLLHIQNYFALLETYFTSHSSSGKTSISFACQVLLFGMYTTVVFHTIKAQRRVCPGNMQVWTGQADKG